MVVEVNQYTANFGFGSAFIDDLIRPPERPLDYVSAAELQD